MHRKKQVAYILLTLLFLVAGTYVKVYGATPKPFKVVIDPGHGGKDPGALGINGLYEKEVNLDIALRLKSLLTAKGYKVVMTRETDKYLSLQERVDIAAREDADLFVSIHANSYRYSDMKGTMVLYYNASKYNPTYEPHPLAVRWSGESEKLAKKILYSVTSKTGTKNMGIVSSNVYVARRATMPSVLVETAFLSSREDAAKLASPEFRQKMAEAICDGILAYEPARFVDIVNHWARKEIVSLSLEGIIQGYRDKTFRPNQGLTRAELVSLLDQATGFEGVEDRQPGQEFPDVQENFWAHDAIMKAQRKGIVTGYHDGLFRPYKPVAREEMAAILYRYLLATGKVEPAAAADGTGAGQTEKTQPVTDAVYQNDTDKPLATKSAVETGFEDVPPSHWASEAIASLYRAGVIQGIDSDHFGLGKPVTRAEAATMLYRILNQFEKN